MAGSHPNDDESNASGDQDESAAASPGPQDNSPGLRRISIGTSRNALTRLPACPASPASGGQPRTPLGSPLSGQTSVSSRIALGNSSSPYRSDSVASPLGSDIYNASDGMASPYKSRRIRNRRQRPPIRQTAFDDVLPPTAETAAAAIRDDEVESEYWDSEADGDLDDIPKAMMGGWNAGESAIFVDEDSENSASLLGGGQRLGNIEMEDAPLDDSVSGEEEDSIVVDDYPEDFSTEEKEDEEGIHSENEHLPPAKRQKREFDGVAKGEK